MSKYKDKEGGVVLSFNGQWISWMHTTTAYSTSLSQRPEANVNG